MFGSPPSSSRACCTILRQSSNLATEPKLATASPPSALISSAIAWAGASPPPSPAPPTPGSTIMILAPSLAINLATSAPTPRAAPVQIAPLPSSMPAIETVPPKNSRRSVDPAPRGFVNSAALLFSLLSAANQQRTLGALQPRRNRRTDDSTYGSTRFWRKLASASGFGFE